MVGSRSLGEAGTAVHVPGAAAAPAALTFGNDGMPRFQLASPGTFSRVSSLLALLRPVASVATTLLGPSWGSARSDKGYHVWR